MIFVGDIHIDKNFPFTNKRTAERWRSLQMHTVGRIMRIADDRIQVGDLFDSFMVNAADFMRGYTIADECRWLIRGNHDVSNNTEQESALWLLEDVVHANKSIVWEDVECWACTGINYVMVPHQRTQKLFEEALEKSVTYCTTQIPNVLVLHCNVSDRPGTDTENYLRSDKLKALAQVFDLIISGHEHDTRQAAGGKVRMTGSILPMNFGEMSDKFVWQLDREANLTPIKVWDAADNYRKLTFQEFLEIPISSELQFIEVTGELNLSESVEVNKRVADWYLKSETIVAIKNNTASMKREVDGVDKKEAALDWVSEVSKQMNDAECEVFMELLSQDSAGDSK